jgi:hypothetical protein
MYAEMYPEMEALQTITMTKAMIKVTTKNLRHCLVVLALLGSTLASAQSRPEKKRWSKHAVLLAVVQLAATGADAYFTNRNMQRNHGEELDPIERPFVHNPATLTALFATEAAGTIYSSYWLRQRDHGKMADAGAASLIASHAYGAAFSSFDFNLWKGSSNGPSTKVISHAEDRRQ